MRFGILVSGSLASTLIIALAANIPIASLVSKVALAMCGKMVQLGAESKSGWTVGSFSKTSNPAPNIILFFNALSKSISFIIPPLDVLIIIEFFLVYIPINPFFYKLLL